MGARCVTGKKMYASREIAEDVLIELWMTNIYPPGQGPLAVYRCDDCGEWHLTSRGPMNARLSEAIQSGAIKRGQEAKKWERKLK